MCEYVIELRVSHTENNKNKINNIFLKNQKDLNDKIFSLWKLYICI